MEFEGNNVILSRQEARNLSEVFGITAQLRNWGPLSQVVKEPTEEEREKARSLSRLITPIDTIWDMEVDDVVVLEPPLQPGIAKIAELALANSQKVVSGLCTPNVCDGYRREWRPAAYRILAMVAEVSEVIQQREEQRRGN